MESGHLEFPGLVTTVFAATGGCGKTTLATNLAVVLVQQGYRVCLVDLDLPLGGIGAALGVESSGAPFGTDVRPYLSNLDCVLAPEAPGEAELVSPAAVEDLLGRLSDEYHHVIVDTPGLLSPQVLIALDSSHRHVLVSTPERPALRRLRDRLDMFDLLPYGWTTRLVVLNRVEPAAGLTPSEIDAELRTPVNAWLPSTPDIPLSINRGVPLARTAPDHPFVRAVREFSREGTSRDRGPPISR